MAEVYLARQSGPAGWEKECVIKRILPTLAADQQFVQMFLDEARIAARLNHPNIVQIFDLGQVGPKEFFIAMEYVHGVDLEQIIDAEKKRGGRVPLHIACRIVASIAEGLDHAHRAVDGRGQPLGLVHRDVSPSNVLISRAGEVKLADFGVAKATLLADVTRGNVRKGKYAYMSPEQVGGEPLTAASDQFSLGILLYELFCGQRPFDGEGPHDTMERIRRADPPDVSSLPARELILRCLAREPLARFATAEQLRRALSEARRSFPAVGEPDLASWSATSAAS